ncbi:MAG: 2-C-methyl-D-erythritol 2,4-cyclodiphosphate synthase [Thermodesulfobacteriaceae bacterium]|nr:2-C-methyl-D-erythritol 2,4-cyclodiphosphate synthase [Thermodesulfobacteriaceae bacterium]MCX8041009.1 2-C-methyl-D-erythritol 2,4-cyclodiphosphate synthase [Thermodesulfobacteriaceae bacterium]MDW8135248.1 2-C-methyl-D-erythritol 2,4-cyclodiphosphate synthase [Thermodesulfobacterium sp.]
MLNLKFGIGFDLHKLVEGRKLILCGVEIPFEKGLYGYSDGDVGLHALMDALLSAGGLPDIGILFPDTDPQYKNFSSVKMLERVLENLKNAGYKPLQIDLIFICEKPKLSPYYDKIKERLSELLKIEPSNIGVKAKTTEGLGWSGDTEIIACFALSVIEKINA